MTHLSSVWVLYNSKTKKRRKEGIKIDRLGVFSNKLSVERDVHDILIFDLSIKDVTQNQN